MAERNWRDEIEPKTGNDHEIIYAEWCPKHNRWVCLVNCNGAILHSTYTIPKPKPKTYRPYKRWEVKCGDVFRSNATGNDSIVVQIRDGEVVLGSGSHFSYQQLLNGFTHIVGTPAGVLES